LLLFDGMGGEKYGEMAAYLAAKTFDTIYPERKKKLMKQFLSEVCEKMNSEICAFVEVNKISQMGTTVAIIAFDKKEVFICNVGDSKIFQHSAGKLLQISLDHVVPTYDDNKPQLTQNLGISKTEFVIEPYIAKGEYTDGDRYLLCSDGLTDMVTVEAIEKTLNEQKSISCCANELMQQALANGGVDNITIILCRIKKKRWIFK